MYIFYLYNLYLYIEIIEFCVYKERYCYKYNTLLVPSFTISSISPSLQNNSTSSYSRGCADYVQDISFPRGPHARTALTGGAKNRVVCPSWPKLGKEPTDAKLKPASGCVRGSVNISERRWPLVVNSGNSHTTGSRDPRGAHGWVSSACRWGCGVQIGAWGAAGVMGEVVGYSGTL